MTDLLYPLVPIVGFVSGYFIVPWIFHGVSPRETWRMLRRHR